MQSKSVAVSLLQKQLLFHQERKKETRKDRSPPLSHMKKFIYDCLRSGHLRIAPLGLMVTTDSGISLPLRSRAVFTA